MTDSVGNLLWEEVPDDHSPIEDGDEDGYESRAESRNRMNRNNSQLSDASEMSGRSDMDADPDSYEEEDDDEIDDPPAVSGKCVAYIFLFFIITIVVVYNIFCAGGGKADSNNGNSGSTTSSSSGSTGGSTTAVPSKQDPNNYDPSTKDPDEEKAKEALAPSADSQAEGIANVFAQANENKCDDNDTECLEKAAEMKRLAKCKSKMWGKEFEECEKKAKEKPKEGWFAWAKKKSYAAYNWTKKKAYSAAGSLKYPDCCYLIKLPCIKCCALCCPACECCCQCLCGPCCPLWCCMCVTACVGGGLTVYCWQCYSTISQTCTCVQSLCSCFNCSTEETNHCISNTSTSENSAFGTNCALHTDQNTCTADTSNNCNWTATSNTQS